MIKRLKLILPLIFLSGILSTLQAQTINEEVEKYLHERVNDEVRGFVLDKKNSPAKVADKLQFEVLAKEFTKHD